MKKTIKFATAAIMSFMLLITSGCSCNLNQKKTNQRSEQLSNTVLKLVNNDVLTDYLGTVKVVKVSSNMVIEKELVVSRDVDGNAYNISTSVGTALVGETITPTTVKEQIYSVNGDIWHVKGESTQILPRSYANVEEAYNAIISENGRELYDDQIANRKWNDISDVYNYYKSIPLNACATIGNPEQLPYYANYNRVLHCTTKRKLFSKLTTYTIEYRRTIDEFTSLTITTDGNQKLVEVKETVSRHNETVFTVSLNIAYDDVNITR